MNQFVQIQGAISQETSWFSRTYNAVDGQIDHIISILFMSPLPGI